MRRVLFILTLISLIVIGKAFAQNISNEGTDFWAVFPTHVPSGSSFATMSVLITSNSNTAGKIKVGGTTINFTVLANNATKVDIPRGLAYIAYTDAGKVVNRGVHVTVDEGKPKVSVYVHIYARARSEAYLVLPVQALEKNIMA